LHVSLVNLVLHIYKFRKNESMNVKKAAWAFAWAASACACAIGYALMRVTILGTLCRWTLSTFQQQQQFEPIWECDKRDKYKRLSGYLRVDISCGHFTVKCRVVTLKGLQKWRERSEFLVRDRPNSLVLSDWPLIFCFSYFLFCFFCFDTTREIRS